MSEVYCVYAQVAARSEGDAGRVAEGYYVLQDGTLTMTDESGLAIRDVEGDKIEHKLKKGENARAIALRLTLKIFRSLRGDADGFNRPLRYQKWVY